MSVHLRSPSDPTELDPTDPADVKDRILRIERHGIEFIPDEERASRPVNLFYILLGGCLTFSLFVIGWFPIAFGLGWWSSFSAVVVGSVAGALLLAPMGLFGPRTGTNNPVSSGAHFGVVGRLIGTFWRHRPPWPSPRSASGPAATRSSAGWTASSAGRTARSRACSATAC